MTPLVSIIIPLYNKMDTVHRAIVSACTQTHPAVEVIVVDDGSTDDSATIVNLAFEEYSNTTLYSIENGGVANARNYGILQSSGDFLCCLDADDWIEPSFIETCLAPLLSDNRIGIAYTKLMTHMPNGDSVVSEWPSKFDADRQFNAKRRMNQVPTCCVFRREGFDRVGGYRQRYAPKGAGSEDAAFWTAMLATGYTAVLATNKALFNYTAFTGNVSGNREYVEKDWLAWYPYTRTEQHPFASPVTPKRVAHVVRDYSEPVVSIVTPVGDGHQGYLQSCIDSVKAQEYWNWELIVVDDTTAQDVDTLWTMKAYPYVKHVKTGGQRGAGVARNMGVDEARGYLLFFLDADDLLNVNTPQALGTMVSEYSKTGNAIYTPYIGRSYVNSLDDLDAKMKQKLVGYDDDDNEVWLRHKVFPYRCEDAIRQPFKLDDAGNPYVWCSVSTLLPKAWHYEVGGFDESLRTWEDVDYFWGIAKRGHCFKMLDVPALIYRFYTGTRRELAFSVDDDNQAVWQKTLEYIKQKYEGVKTMGCNCGSKNKKQTTTLPNGVINSTTEALTMSSSDYVLIEFHFQGEETRSNYGKPLRSPTGKTGNNGRILEYGGYGRNAGDQFLVHKDDQRVRPDLFHLVDNPTPTPPKTTKEIPAPPPTLKAKPAPKPTEPIEPTEPKPTPEPEDGTGTILDSLPLNVTQVQSLQDAGLVTLADIADARVDGLKELQGFGSVSAKKVMSVVNDLV